MTSTPAVDTGDVLDALSDPDCRAILAATGDRPLTVSELGSACGLPRSTLYRKVETLVEAGLLEERVRMREHGPHPSAYVRRVAAVEVRFTGEGPRVGLVPDHLAEPPRPADGVEAPAVRSVRPVRAVAPVGAAVAPVVPRGGWLDGPPD